MRTLNFEGVKVGLKQSKDGFILTLAVHPDELPDDLMRDFVGSRYQVVMVRLGDNEQPISREGEFPGDHAVKLAGIICRDSDFWEYIFQVHNDQVASEKAAAQWLCIYIGIESRKELKTNTDARELFHKLKHSFDLWKTQ